MTSMTGRGFERMNPNCVVWCSMDQVRFAGGRSNLVDLVKHTSRLRNPAQVRSENRSDQGSLAGAGCISGIRARAREIGPIFRSLRAR